MSTLSTETAGRDAAQKNGRQPEGAARSDLTMLKVAEKPVEGNAETASFVGFSLQHRAAMWLDEEVKKSKSGVTTQIVELTPALAEVLLERNPENRKLRDGDVESYARDISYGQWAFNGEAIIVSKDGSLNDGQHRCAAVVKSGKAIHTVLIIGVDRASRTTLDQGRARTVGDYLAMDGHVNTLHLGAAANFIWQHRARGSISTGGSQRATKGEIMRMVDDHPSIIESVGVVQRKGAPAYGGPSMLAFCHWTFWQASDRATADDFMTRLVDGANLMSRDPILYLRNRLVAERGKMRSSDRAELIFRSWNAWRRNETPRVLPVLGGTLPVVEA